MFGDILSWSQAKNTDVVQPRSSVAVKLKIVILGIFAIVFSLCGALWLAVSRRKIVIFSMDKTSGSYQNDFRIDYLYRVLEEKKLPYFEIIHTVLGRKMIKNLFARKRSAFYLEAVDFLAFPFVLKEKRRIYDMHKTTDENLFAPEERELMKKLYTKYASSMVISKARVAFFRYLLRASNVSDIYTIDDVRSISELALAAQMQGVSFTAIQHGHFTKYHVGWLTMTRIPGKIIAARKLLVWSEFWKQELLRLSTYFSPDQIIISGEKSLFVPVQKTHDEKISVLFPYEKNAPKAEIFRYLEELMKYSNIELCFKLRPDEDKQTQIDLYGLAPFLSKITLVRDIRDVLPRVDVVIGTYSSFLYDMVALERPVLILETSIDYGEGMIENTLAGRLLYGDDIYRAIKDASETPQEILVERREKLVGKKPLLLEDTLKEIISKDCRH